MEVPGASTSTPVEMFEKLEIASAFVVDPTVTAEGTQPGDETPSTKPSLPADMTVMVRRNRSAAMAGTRASFAHGTRWIGPPPRLMFTDTIGPSDSTLWDRSWFSPAI
jgi:hypothetical protein